MTSSWRPRRSLETSTRAVLRSQISVKKPVASPAMCARATSLKSDVDDHVNFFRSGVALRQTYGADFRIGYTPLARDWSTAAAAGERRKGGAPA